MVDSWRVLVPNWSQSAEGIGPALTADTLKLLGQMP